MTALAVNRSDVFPVGTTVKAYPVATRATSAKPAGPATAEAVVDATGKWEVDVETGRYVLHAEVAGEQRQLVADNRAFAGRPPLRDRIASRRIAAGVEYG